MSSHVRTFKPEFWDRILNGTKRRTLRMVPKRMPKAGDTLQLRGGKGTKQEILGESTILSVKTVVLHSDEVESDGFFVDEDTFAQADGFPDYPAMWKWFAKTYKLKAGDIFRGILIEWGTLHG